MSVETGSAPSATQKVFVCYRREDTAPYAGRIYDAMVARYGSDNVFMDLELPPGIDFVDRITNVVSGCVALIVVIGPRWTQLQNEDGTRRIEDPDDFVRLEVETGLDHHAVTPIPVLVGGASMPHREDLPPALRPITRRNALELSEGRWRYDVGRLMSTLDVLLPDGSEPVAPPEPTPGPPPAESSLPSWWLALEGTLVAGVTAAIGRSFGEVVSFKEAHSDETRREVLTHVVSELGRRTETFALVGVALAAWLALRVLRVDPAKPALRGLTFGLLAGVLGGLVLSLPLYLPSAKVTWPARGWIEMAALAVSGGVLGTLIGTVWAPSRAAAARALGGLGGVLFYVVVLILGWKSATIGERVLIAALGAATVVGPALAAMVALDRREARE